MQVGLSLLLYPSAAAWVSQYNQSNIVFDQVEANAEAARNKLKVGLSEARKYNELLQSGAIYSGGANVAEGTGIAISEAGESFDYWKLLKASPTGTMARLLVPSIDLDLPVYHGTSDETLLKGVGHLQGTSLPVGGAGTRSVLTGHRGLANSTMFTNLDKVEKGDSIIIEVLGEVLTYRVMKIEVVDPDATEEIRAEAHRDLVTLVTCTPLGINTHRILITGERVTPTPAEDVTMANTRPQVPGFPWWAVYYTVGTAAVWVTFWRAGYRNGQRGRRRARQ
ncbi:class C sortase [Leucobacter denitrificans]|uniref:class C sortase n=1 Tax=Leucobacter denitrificans TaxID=683042 RepID=UPI001CB72EEC|nr:class C sortase [Leucobacter denitrificans]